MPEDDGQRIQSDKAELRRQGIRVNVTPESVRRLSTSLVKETIDFQQSRSGTFKIVPGDRPGQAYLFPAYPIQQTFSFQRETIRSLYKIPNEVWDKVWDNPEAAKLQEPAVVEQIGDGQWRLLSRGKIGDKEAQVEESKPSQEEPLEQSWLAQDSDGDGLTNGEELRLGTSPYSADTDGDGISDGVEAMVGTDPTLPAPSASQPIDIQAPFKPFLDSIPESNLHSQNQSIDAPLNISSREPEEAPVIEETPPQNALAAQGGQKTSFIDSLYRRLSERSDLDLSQTTLFVYQDQELLYQGNSQAEQYNALTVEQNELLQQILDDPSKFQGEITIAVNDQVIFQVEDGITRVDTYGLAHNEKITETQLDPLNHGLHQQVGHQRDQVEDLASRTMSTVIEPSIKLMLEKVGQRQADGSLSFESRDYRYEQRNDRVSIIPKDGRPALTPTNMQPRDMQVALAVSEKAQAKYGQDQTQQRQSPVKVKMK